MISSGPTLFVGEFNLYTILVSLWCKLNVSSRLYARNKKIKERNKKIIVKVKVRAKTRRKKMTN